MAKNIKEELNELRYEFQLIEKTVCSYEDTKSIGSL